MSWLEFIVYMWWGAVVLAAVRLLTGSVSIKRIEREITQLRADVNVERIHERLTELESQNTSVRNRLESLKSPATVGSRWGK